MWNLFIEIQYLDNYMVKQPKPAVILCIHCRSGTTLVWTPGLSRIPHLIPLEMIPTLTDWVLVLRLVYSTMVTWVALLFQNLQRGPPESPWQASTPPTFPFMYSDSSPISCMPSSSAFSGNAMASTLEFFAFNNKKILVNYISSPTVLYWMVIKSPLSSSLLLTLTDLSLDSSSFTKFPAHNSNPTEKLSDGGLRWPSRNLEEITSSVQEL